MKRTRERLGIPKKSAERNAQRAIKSGVSRLHTSGKLRRYLDALWWSDTPKDGICVYHRNVYVFNKGVLVTVMALPKRYYVAADKAEAEIAKEGDKAK